MPELTLTLADAAALRALFDEQLSKRRAFVADGRGVEVASSCTLLLRCGARSHELRAEVVYVRAEDPGRGIGVQLAPLDEEAMASLRAFVELEDAPVAAEGERQESEPLRMHERIRTLSAAEQQKTAASGSLSERIALERTFGALVWETLLRNARITIPEVSRIARKGTLPRPLVEMIAANATWIAAGEVQRALLSNPRSTSAVLGRVLQSLSRGDLSRVSLQTAYPMTVRVAAKKLLGTG